MPFLVSNSVGISVPEPGEAAKFYQEMLRMTLIGYEDGIHLDAGGLNFFIDPGKRMQPLTELIYDNPIQIKSELRRFGFEEVIWNYPDNPNLVVDPFAILWNIHFEVPESPIQSPDFQNHLVLPKIGFHNPYPERAAKYFAQILQSTALEIMDGWIVDCVNVRLMFQNKLPIGPVFFLRSDFDLSLIDPALEPGQEIAVDPFGVRWKLGAAQVSDSAVVQTKLKP